MTYHHSLDAGSDFIRVMGETNLSIFIFQLLHLGAFGAKERYEEAADLYTQVLNPIEGVVTPVELRIRISVVAAFLVAPRNWTRRLNMAAY